VGLMIGRLVVYDYVVPSSISMDNTPVVNELGQGVRRGYGFLRCIHTLRGERGCNASGVEWSGVECF